MYILDQTNEWNVNVYQFDLRDEQIKKERKQLFEYFLKDSSTLDYFNNNNSNVNKFGKLVISCIKNSINIKF